MGSLEAIDNLELLYSKFGYLLIFVTSFIESSPFGWITPGGILISLGSFFAYSHKLSLWGVVISGFSGTWLMLLLAYYIGQRTADVVSDKVGQKKQIKAAQKLLNKYGAVILTTNLTSNVTRFWVSYVAGSQKINRNKFTIYSALASATWVFIWTIVGQLLGTRKASIYSLIPKLGILSWLLLFIAVASIIYSSYKDRKGAGETDL